MHGHPKGDIPNEPNAIPFHNLNKDLTSVDKPIRPAKNHDEVQAWRARNLASRSESDIDNVSCHLLRVRQHSKRQ